MQRRILKHILKRTKQHEDVGSLIFGIIVFVSLIIVGGNILFSRVPFKAVTQSIELYINAPIESFWSNIITPESRVKTIEETLRTTKNATNVTSSDNRTHKTITSDTLWKLAIRYYNDGYRWTKIYEANKKVIPDPNKLDNGITLVIPE